MSKAKIKLRKFTKPIFSLNRRSNFFLRKRRLTAKTFKNKRFFVKYKNTRFYNKKLKRLQRTKGTRKKSYTQLRTNILKAKTLKFKKPLKKNVRKNQKTKQNSINSIKHLLKYKKNPRNR
jgi:hypothetical protein